MIRTAWTVALLLLGDRLALAIGALAPGPPPQAQGTQLVLSTCALPKKLSTELWSELKVDDYIKNYPNGNQLSVHDFARQHGAQNFLCGIGEKCNVGQMCYPVQGLAWYVLLATQEYNLFMNKMFKAVGTTMDLVRSTMASLIIDITQPPESHNRHTIWINTAVLVSAITVSLSLGLFLGIVTVIADSAWLVVAMVAGYLGLASNGVMSGLSLNSIAQTIKQRHEPTAFEDWAQFAFYFSECQDLMQRGIASSLSATLKTGISDTGPNSLASLLSNGTFIEPRAKKSTSEIESSLKEVTQLRALVILLQSMNAFVTRGAEPCNGHGLNGARDEDRHLSFCGPDNVMMNIVTARKDKIRNEVYHARLISSKYGITTEYLTTRSWECQKKYGMGHDPYRSSALPLTTDAECIANLPVCDCTQPEIQQELKHKNLIQFCRETRKLPI